MTRLTTIAAVVGLTLSLSCGGEREYSGSPPDACLDMAEVVADALSRCGQDYQANYDAFVAAVADGDCDNITGVRDPDALYGECIPWFESASCDEVTNTDHAPDSCGRQLLR